MNSLSPLGNVILYAGIALYFYGIIQAMKLLQQIAHTQERVASALETIGRKLEGGDKPGAH